MLGRRRLRTGSEILELPPGKRDRWLELPVAWLTHRLIGSPGGGLDRSPGPSLRLR